MKILFPTASLAVLLASPLMTGCMHHGSVRSVTETDNGTTIALGRHDVLEVILPGNPTTGYSWQTVQVNSWVLAPLRRPIFTPASAAASTGTNDAPRVGAGGSFRMTYEAVGTGTSPLELSYTRPWEPETNPSQTFKITVNVAQ